MSANIRLNDQQSNDVKESEYPADLNCTNRIADLLSDRIFSVKGELS